MSETIKYIYSEFLFYKFPGFWESIWNRGLQLVKKITEDTWSFKNKPLCESY